MAMKFETNWAITRLVQEIFPRSLHSSSIVVIVMFKLLHLAEICILTSTFQFKKRSLKIPSRSSRSNELINHNGGSLFGYSYFMTTWLNLNLIEVLSLPPSSTVLVVLHLH